MLCNFTVNGTLIPKDPEGNDMCVLFLKYGRCRFKQKCKKSHWVPPLPEEPFPVEVKPPLPNDEQPDREGTNEPTNKPTTSLVLISSDPEILQETNFDRSYSKNNMELNSPESNKVKQNVENTTSQTNVGIQPCTSEARPSKTRTWVMLRRFAHVFQDNGTTKHSGIEKMFGEAGVYFDKMQQKVMPANPPQNKTEKRNLKLIRRLHWNYTQQLKERLSQFPPSYNLKFDRTKVNFNRLRPYIYILIHECLCPGGARKSVKPSSFVYLIADTLIVYLEMKYITAQEAEAKLQTWGARSVRARQCIDHLWHIMAISSKTPEGCINEIFDIEQEVLKKSRTALDYAYCCHRALKQTTLKEITINDEHFPRKVSSAVRQGLEAQRKSLEKKRESTTKLAQTAFGNQGNVELETTKNMNVLSVKIQKKRRRSKRFKSVSLHERKKIETRCLNLLKTLN